MVQYDVVIAGGGPAGSAAAIVLARAGRRVLLVDEGRGPSFRIGEGLPPSAHPLLQDLGVLDRFLADGHRVSYGNLCAWGSDQPGSSDFIYSLHGNGYQLDRNRFDAMLRAAAAHAGAEIHTKTRISMAQHHAEVAEGRVFQMSAAGRQSMVTCHWLIDACGRSAFLSRRLGGIRHRQDRLAATAMLLTSGLTAPKDLDGRTLVEACQDGWWYSALLPSGLRLVAYLTDLDLPGHQALRNCAALWSRLLATQMLSELCHRHAYAPIGPARSADASTGSLEHCIGGDWLAVGDAALSFDPLSSQGITTALHTGIMAARAVDAALNGSRGRVHDYGVHVKSIREAYLYHRRTSYRTEQRWPQSPFWRRRHEPAAFHLAGKLKVDCEK